ncbi:hypothetical protein SEA_GOBY_53 [Streptomyces phage Goby]|uniref:Uncharacterized protein n=4 Tax=Likavirus TaxID=1982880 RepID=R4TAT1_9CAUD|nr:hypothetical protein M051_gp52 [Streptomyces phage Lika]YP_008051455.1 hypothetical protein M050_gp53 [Streptomyces phage Sujidade]YP_010056606.1 hypothetical protein KGH00_gp53 [Streptomyces phage Goby]ATE85158.1 hypothetical protein SEA_DATTRAN_55 [Streptomyces phage Dattran]AWN07647.1 hypothetical protein SEA_TOMA_53 [Streptomyces phage Toma]AGM12075.1 hypothetical protein LIKA_52 [Streptomyces phage Lika]AGM12151.1 hypothetical protein SUJIDADE_53 [Streptomyces phage Sujidade]AWN07571
MKPTSIEFWRLRWTALDGKRMTSAVSYDRTVRDERLAELAAQGVTDAEPFLYDPFNDEEM